MIVFGFSYGDSCGGASGALEHSMVNAVLEIFSRE